MKIKFKCAIPEVAKTMPIVRSSQINYDWYQRAKDDIGNLSVSTAKCPGIIGVNVKGWVQRLYQDVTITTFGDGRTFKVFTEIEQYNEKLGKFIGPYVNYHTADQLRKYKDFLPNTLDTIIKIQSPWFVEIPEGYSLLSIPIPYNDDMRFTSAAGILKGNAALNVQLFWHCLRGRETIPAGTPIQQYILIKDEVYEEEIEAISNKQDLLDLELPFPGPPDPFLRG